MKSYGSVIIGFLLILAMAACKTKQVVQKDEVTEIKASTDSVKVDMEDNVFVAYLPPGDFMDDADSSSIPGEGIYNFPKAFSWVPKLIKKNPRVTRGGWFIYQSRKASKSNIKSESKDLEKSNTVVEQKNKKENKSNCHNVLFLIVFVVFICLVVRYRKIIEKLFGAY